MLAWANDARAQPPKSALNDAPNTVETIANVATTAEVLATIVNNVGAEQVALDEQTRLNVRAAALEEKIHYLTATPAELATVPHRQLVTDQANHDHSVSASLGRIAG